MRNIVATRLGLIGLALFPIALFGLLSYPSQGPAIVYASILAWMAAVACYGGGWYLSVRDKHVDASLQKLFPWGMAALGCFWLVCAVATGMGGLPAGNDPDRVLLVSFVYGVIGVLFFGVGALFASIGTECLSPTEGERAGSAE